MGELQYLSPLSKLDEIKQLSGFPKLKPAYILKVNTGTTRPIGNVLGGSNLVHVDTPTGTLTSAEGYEQALEAEVVYGSDWLAFDADNEYARPNLKFLAKTKDGAILNCAYHGIGKASPPVLSILQGDPNAKTIPFGISSNTHTFQSGDPRYKHLENKTFVSNGRFVVNRDPVSVTVELAWSI